MLSKKPILKTQRIENQLGRYKYPRNQRYDENVLSSASNICYLAYSDANGKRKTLPVSAEEADFIKRESDTPIFYTRTFIGGERIFLEYNSKSDSIPKEILVNYPYKRLRSSKCYSTKELQPCPEQNYTLIWELENNLE